MYISTLIPIWQMLVNLNISELSSTGVETGRCCITAFIGFWDFGWRVIALEVSEKSAMFS
jgi:hypothetical protein